MKRWKCEKKLNSYSLYFDDKNYMLTIEGENALLRNENKYQNNQLFSFIDVQEN